MPIAPRTALFLPASNPRAVAKARTLPADMVILDLEDAVAPADKARARDGAVAALGQGFGDRLVAVRLNAAGTPDNAADRAALQGCRLDYLVLPKVEDAASATAMAQAIDRPCLAMIETPAGVLSAPAIAAADGVAGLIAGTNDLRRALAIPPATARDGLLHALQAIVLAARAAGGWAIDGVWNALDDDAGLAAECAQGRGWGFDGKALIHPGQIATANRVFAPSADEVEDARALVDAYAGGAHRFRDRMIEDMHVAAAHALLARADARGA